MPQQLELRGLVGDEVESAFVRLQTALSQRAQKRSLTLVTPGAATANLEADWHPSDGYWVTFQREATGRHLCSYGVVDPAKETSQSFVLQINVQATDPWTRMGAFATDGRAIYYLHTGKLSGRPTFAERYPGQKALARWVGHAAVTYFVVAKLGDRRAAAQVSAYVKAVARFRGGGVLEEEYRGAFELGLAEAIRELQVRLGGADAVAAPQIGGIQVAPPTGPIEVQAARARLDFLKLLDEKMRYDPYLLAAPVEKIATSVQAERQRRLVYSIGAAILSTGGGWLLSAVNPSNVAGVAQAVYAALASILPFLPH